MCANLIFCSFFYYQKRIFRSSFFSFFCVRDVYKRESLLLCMGWSSVNWIVRSQRVFYCSVAHVRVERSQVEFIFDVERWGFYMGQFKPTIIIQLKGKKKSLYLISNQVFQLCFVTVFIFYFQDFVFENMKKENNFFVFLK